VQSNTTKTISVSCTQLRNKQNNNPINGLTKKWIEYIDKNRDDESCEALACALDHVLRSMLPDGRLREITKGSEGEIRNEAALTCLNKYFEGNAELANATRKLDGEEIANQLSRCINAAIRNHSARIRDELVKRTGPLIELEDTTLLPDSCRVEHGSMRRSPHALPVPLRADLVMKSIDEALSNDEIAKETVSIIKEMSEVGMTQAQAGRRHRISRQAVRQRLRRTASAINKILETKEISSL
jgi:hypothetical protein